MSASCPSCGGEVDPRGGWCGSCGARLPAPDDVVAETRTAAGTDGAVTDPAGDPDVGTDTGVAGKEPGGAGPDAPDQAPTRRRVLQLLGAGALGLGVGWLARGLTRSDWVDVGRVDVLLDRIETDGWIPAPAVGDDPVHAIVRWDPSIVRQDGLESRIVYASEPVVDRTTGLMVLVLRSPHGGCDTPFCESSRWFEDVCFGSRFNGWGEWVSGPSPRSLDRRPARLVDGRLEVNRTGYTVGATRERRMSAQEAAGPSCADL